MSAGADAPVDVTTTTSAVSDDTPAGTGGCPEQQQPAAKARRPRLGRAKAVSKPPSSVVAQDEASLPPVDAEFFAGLTMTLRKMEQERRAKRLDGFSLV